MKKLLLGLIVLSLMGCGDITNEEAEAIMPPAVHLNLINGG